MTSPLITCSLILLLVNNQIICLFCYDEAYSTPVEVSRRRITITPGSVALCSTQNEWNLILNFEEKDIEGNISVLRWWPCLHDFLFFITFSSVFLSLVLQSIHTSLSARWPTAFHCPFHLSYVLWMSYPLSSSSCLQYISTVRFWFWVEVSYLFSFPWKLVR